LQVREGATGPRVVEFAAVQVGARRPRQPGPPAGRLIRRAVGEEPEVKSDVSHAAAATPLTTLAQVACCRVRGAEFFGVATSYLGLAPLTLVGRAPRFVTLAWTRLPQQGRN
jgi:hypothetical protein